jgi:hypothetical protein
MSPDSLLNARLVEIARRQQRVGLWSRLAACWTGAALLGLTLNAFQRQTGWASSLSLPIVGLFGLAAAVLVLLSQRRARPDRRALARQIESCHPELDGRLLTAIQQQPQSNGQFTFLQERVLGEALQHGERADWAAFIPKSRLRLAQAAHWLAVLLLLLVLSNLRVTGGHQLLARIPSSGVTVTPGDTTLERGSSLVVLARFQGNLPPGVDLIIGPSPESTRRIPLVKSLSDPMFGGSVSEVASNLVYHVEYAGQRTRDFTVSVFEYPRLERADADVTAPGYTGQPRKHIEDTRRLSAVEGSYLDLSLRLNKPVASARLVSKDKEHAALSLHVQTNQPIALLKDLPLAFSKSYELQLLDAEGRTNKVPAQFVFEVFTNRPPELHLASPRGDLKPSPLEEIPFEGTVWDDFGVPAYGLAYTVAGQETKFVELGHAVPGREKQTFKYMLRLEDLKAQPDELISWFIWADDLGPDGQLRRTTGDLFFAEVRPFDEIFREGQAAGGQDQDMAGQMQSGGRNSPLAELQKQIAIATWKLVREHCPERRAPALRDPASTNSQTWYQTPSELRPARHSGEPRLILSRFAAQVSASSAGDEPSPSSATESASHPPLPRSLDDIPVLIEAQSQALAQARAAAQRQRDPRAVPLWSAAIKNMEQALARLSAATNSPASLAEAVSAEQAAYQALMRLQQHEFQVMRSRNLRQRGGSGDQQTERQLEEMELTQTENRYETQRQAQAPQTSQRREQLQVMNRLQELARRQQDLNDRLKELQTALQEARTDEERAEIQRRLKRLEEEERQMLADADELRQRMDRPENQSRMADERRQLEQTRQDVQRAAEAAGAGAVSQALAAGTRAQRELQQLRDQVRKENSSQFADDLRDMRAQARDLARQQEDLLQKMNSEAGSEHKSLSGPDQRSAMLDQLAKQKERLTNLVERATQVSQQAEDAEPLLSRELYDTVRKFTQDSGKSVKEVQNELLQRGLANRSLVDQLKDDSQPDAAKMLDLTSGLLRQDFLPQASETAQRSGADMENFKRGVERAAESVLGDDTEALRLAQQELDKLTEQLQREMAGADSGTNQPAGNGSLSTARREGGEGSQRAGDRRALAAGSETNALATSERDAEQQSQAGGQTGQDSEQANSPSNQRGARSQTPGDQPASGGEGRQANAADSANGGQQNEQPSGNQAGGGRQSSPGREDAGGITQRRNRDRRSLSSNAPDTANGGAYDTAGGGAGGYAGENYGRGVNRLLDERLAHDFGPLTGEDFVNWSDRLRDVEEMIEQRDLRNEVAAARERARVLRQEFRSDHKKPDWAVVRLQVMQPLAEVRDRIADELARRESREALVPIDRDPVPNRYSDLVRRYYEELGK